MAAVKTVLTFAVPVALVFWAICASAASSHSDDRALHNTLPQSEKIRYHRIILSKLLGASVIDEHAACLREAFDPQKSPAPGSGKLFSVGDGFLLGFMDGPDSIPNTSSMDEEVLAGLFVLLNVECGRPLPW